MMTLSERSSFLPPGLAIDVANFCNLRCPGCGYTVNFDKIKARSYPIDRFERIMEEVKDHAIVVLLYLSGEPLLHSDFAALVRGANSRGIATMTSTNASFRLKGDWAEELVDAGLDTIIFSVSGVTQEIYQKYHVGGKVSFVMDNIRAMSRAKKNLKKSNPIVHIRYLNTEHNSHEIEPFRKFALEQSCDVFEVRNALNLVTEDNSEPPIGETDPLIPADYYGPGQLGNACHWTYLMPVLKMDGSVVPCCYDYYQLPSLGNSESGSLSQTWNGPSYRNFRKFMASRRKDIPVCAACPTKIGFQSNFGDEKRVNKIPTAVSGKVGARS